MLLPSRKSRVLIVDDKAEMGQMLSSGLTDYGYETISLNSSRHALVLIQEGQYDALVTDLRMPDVDGLELLKKSRLEHPEKPVIVMTAFGAVDSAIESIRVGAYHYLTKPFKLEELNIFLKRALEESSLRQETAALKTTLRQRFAGARSTGQSPAMREVLDTVERVAVTDVPILLMGETGTGKGYVAQAIHAESNRAARPFVSVNCAALPEPLLESELFGHLKGAFTGASAARMGLFMEANGGTLFLDEIGDMPLALQGKLLHVLESQSIRPVGASKERPIDVRIIAATHRDLKQHVKSGLFREDLLYRLDVVSILIPPLRQRREDLAALIDYFFETAKHRHPHSAAQRLSPDAFQSLLNYQWPGNVRELSHAMERIVLLGRHPEILGTSLPSAVRDAGGTFLGPGAEVLPIRKIQRQYAKWALIQCEHQRGRTAEKLGVDPKTLAKWLDEPEEAVS